MPIYEFECSKCEDRFDSYEPPETTVAACPSCNLPTGSRVPSTFGGYQINGDNSASQRPKGAGSRRD
jgi:putative FmdB family regulatory protein